MSIWTYASKSGVNLKNQDYVSKRGPVSVVADGLGGHIRGSEASVITVRSTIGELRHSNISPNDIKTAIRVADRNLYKFHSDLEIKNYQRPPASTVVVAVNNPRFDEIPIVSVGDSDAILVSPDGSVESLFGELNNHSAVLDNCVGMLNCGYGDSVFKTVLLSRSKHVGSVLMLATDGLWSSCLSDESLIALVSRLTVKHDVGELAKAIIQAVSSHQAKDDITLSVSIL